MAWCALVMFAPLLAMLIWAAVGDLRDRRIPNWLTLAIATTGITQSFTSCATVSPWQSAGGIGVGLALMIGLFVLGARGGGDVKLLAATGAWVGPLGIFFVFLAEAIIGMVIVLMQALYQGRLLALLRNTVVLTINLVHVRELGLEHTKATGESCRSIDKPLPFAVPVLIAVVAVLLWGGRLP